jgi:RimJ/RimL family protein N-acetyltransferase
LFTGEKVRLRAFREEDTDRFVEWESDLETRLLMDDGIPFPPQPDKLRSLPETLASGEDAFLFAVETLDGEFIGSLAVFDINWHHRFARIGISIGKPHQGKGYGSDAIRIWARFAFRQMNLRKLKLTVFAFNRRAIRAYQKCGFRVEGVLREELYRNGQYHDVLVMGLLRSDFAALEERKPTSTQQNYD